MWGGGVCVGGGGGWGVSECVCVCVHSSLQLPVLNYSED